MGDVNATEKIFTSSDTDNLEVDELLYEERNHLDVSYLHLVYMFLVHSFARPIQNARVIIVMKRVFINVTLLAHLLLIWIWTLLFLWNWMINMTRCVFFTILSNMSDTLLLRNLPAIVGPVLPHQLSTYGGHSLRTWLS